MRNAFAQELVELAAADERIVLLSGDIGNRLFDGFKARCPNRFFNCGVAEANMMSTAAGMALCGFRRASRFSISRIGEKCDVLNFKGATSFTLDISEEIRSCISQKHRKVASKDAVKTIRYFTGNETAIICSLQDC